MGSAGIAFVEHLLEVFTRVSPATEEQADHATLTCGEDAGGEDACTCFRVRIRLVLLLANELLDREDAGDGIVVVQHLAGRRLADELRPDGLDLGEVGGQQIPLRAGGQRNAVVALHLLDAVHRQTAPIAQERQHRSDVRIVLLQARFDRRGGPEDLPARAAAQGLQVEARGGDRRLSPDSQQHGGSVGVVESALHAGRAGIAGLELGVSHHHPLGAGVRGGGSPSVPRTLGPLAAAGLPWALPGRRNGRRGREHGAGLLRTRSENQTQ